MSWHLESDGGRRREIIYWPDQYSTAEFGDIRGGNPILFPFAGRSFDQGAINLWRGPDGVQRPMPIHGFARHSRFQLRNLDASGFSAVLIPDAEAKRCYPYDFEFEVAYRFEAFALHCELSLHNRDTQALPWCAGHHPYFSLPWSDESVQKNFRIHLPATKTWNHDYDGFGKLISRPCLNGDQPLATPALVDAIHSGLSSNKIYFGDQSSPSTTHIRFGSSEKPPEGSCLVTWSQAGLPYYCIEPWMGVPNAFENKVGLDWVQPRQTRRFGISIVAA